MVSCAPVARASSPCLADGNIGLLEVARKRYSTRDEVSISPKLAVVSARLAAVFGPVSPDRAPEAMLQHWYRSSEAIHHSSGRDDLRATEECWDYLDTRDPATWSAALDDLEFRLVPALRDHVTDSGLLRCWTDERGVNEGPLQQLVYRALLLRDLDPDNLDAACADIAEQVRQLGPRNGMVRHVARGLAALGIHGA